MRRQTVAVLVLILAAGCTQSPELTDQDWITELVSGSEIAQTSNLNGTGDPVDSKSGGEVDVPEYWFRQITSEPAPEIILENDPAAGVCTVTVIHQVLAELVIDTVHDGVYQPGSKEIEDTRFLRLVVVKDENEDINGGWRIASVTPAEHILTGEGQDVFISSMSIYKDDQLIWECTDPGDFYDVNTGLPQLLEGDLVRMEVTVNHLDPEYDPAYFVIAHGPLSVHNRHLMFDNGLFGDLTAGDGIYSYQWYVEYTGLHQRIAADVIDADTFADQTEDDYDAGAWGIRFLN